MFKNTVEGKDRLYHTSVINPGIIPQAHWSQNKTLNENRLLCLLHGVLHPIEVHVLLIFDYAVRVKLVNCCVLSG